MGPLTGRAYFMALFSSDAPEMIEGQRREQKTAATIMACINHCYNCDLLPSNATHAGYNHVTAEEKAGPQEKDHSAAHLPFPLLLRCQP